MQLRGAEWSRVYAPAAHLHVHQISQGKREGGVIVAVQMKESYWSVWWQLKSILGGQIAPNDLYREVSAVCPSCPQSILNRHSAYFFVPLSLRLLNEESPTCRQMVATAIKALLQKVKGSWCVVNVLLYVYLIFFFCSLIRNGGMRLHWLLRLGLKTARLGAWELARVHGGNSLSRNINTRGHRIYPQCRGFGWCAFVIKTKPLHWR